MDINQLHQALDKLMIVSQEEKGQKGYPSQQQQSRRQVNSFNPENYYPNPNNVSNKNVSYYTTTVNPNSLNSDEYYNDEYYNSGRSYNNSSLPSEYYYARNSRGNSSQSSAENTTRDKKTRNVEQLKIQTNSKTHSRTHSYSSDHIMSPKSNTFERRGSQDTVGSAVTPNSSYSQSSASLNEPMTASIKSDLNCVTLQSLSFDLVTGYLNRITSSPGFIKNTKRYYFVLDTDGLYYFKTNNPSEIAKGLIKFDTKTKIKDIKENSPAKDKSSRLLELEVYKDNKSHQVVLQAEDPEDRDMWHRAIKKMIIRQKYLNEALPPIPQTPTQPIQINGPSAAMHNRSRSRSNSNNSQSLSQSQLSQSQHSRNYSPNQSLSYTQQIRLAQAAQAQAQAQQKLYLDGGSLPLSKKSSLQNINELAAPPMYNMPNRRRPSFDIQMLQRHSRNSSLSSLNEYNSTKQRYSYGSNYSMNSMNSMNHQ